MTKSNEWIESCARKPITFTYQSPDQRLVQDLIQNQELVLLQDTSQITLDHSYFKIPLEGATNRAYTRAAVAKKLVEATRLLSGNFQFIIFDAFRSRLTQRSLFDHVAKQISSAQPFLNPEEVFRATQKYIVHPDDRTGFPVPPHNSGGAIDLALMQDGELLNFGTGFDDPSPASFTSYFERDFDPSLGILEADWMRIRTNRRILFHTLVSLGFTNYQEEWWHYDLGDCMWAREFNREPIFDSLEPEVDKHERSLQP